MRGVTFKAYLVWFFFFNFLNKLLKKLYLEKKNERFKKAWFQTRILQQVLILTSICNFFIIINFILSKEYESMELIYE